MRRTSVVSAVAALAALACGGGPAPIEKLREERRALCDATLASGSTVSQAATAFGPGARIFDFPQCRTDFVPPNGTCDTSRPLCRIVWEWIDSVVCEGGGRGCFYRCTTFVPQPAPDPPRTLVIDDFSPQTICSAAFADRQPL
jgi:hypothetical protein